MDEISVRKKGGLHAVEAAFSAVCAGGGDARVVLREIIIVFEVAFDSGRVIEEI
jgi:hypothetical protein